MVAVVGAGAMGTALAFVHVRGGKPTTLLGTRFDDATIEACRAGRPHPALGVTLPPGVDCRRYDAWAAVLRNIDRVVIAVSSDGLADITADVAARLGPRADWVIATKGWDPDTLRTPSEILSEFSDRFAVLGGPALAPELVANAPTAMVCASPHLDVAQDVAATFTAGGVCVETTDDVVGVEIAAAYKNVTAIAVGMCEGLSERLPESVFIHRFANARAAVFAQGLKDMSALALVRGGRPETIFGLAGAGDLYVTCLGGRNGNFGRLLGEGQTPDQAKQAIGSTVEGVANTYAALAVAEKAGCEVKAALAVASVLAGDASPEQAITNILRSAS
jgi:glycerol-3-phosphate dehydrogenase (NAD(P)+)